MDRDTVIKEVFGATQWKQLEPIFIKEAERLRTTKQVAEFAVKWGFYLHYNTADNTLKSRSWSMRKALKNAGVKEDNIAHTILSLPSSFFKLLNEKANKKVIEKLEVETEVEVDYTKLANDILLYLNDRIENKDVLAKSNNSSVERELAYLKLFFVLLATGRRQIEILKTIDIAKRKEMALFRGLAKKKNDNKNEITAPILYDVNIIKKYIKDIRKEFGSKEMTNKEVNQKLNYPTNRAFKKYFKDKYEFVEKKGLHFLRTIYAITCYQNFGNDVDKEVYIAKILGHEVKITAVKNYQANARDV